MKHLLLFAIVVLAGTTQAPLPQQSRTIRESSKERSNTFGFQPEHSRWAARPRDRDCEQDEKPAHRVALSKGFWMGQTLVTVRSFKRFATTKSSRCRSTLSLIRSGPRRTPITNVSWNDANALCAWAGGRLPTEGGMGIRARAGSTAIRDGKIDDIAWYFTYGVAENRRRGSETPNAFGLFDMSGNVWELLNDWYAADYYQTSPPQDPTGPSTGKYHVLRGGSGSSIPRYVRTSFRFRDFPDNRYDTYGFGCVQEAVGP